MVFGFGYNFGDFIKSARMGGAMRPMVMPTGMPLISRDLRGIPVAIPRVDSVDNTFKQGGVPKYNKGGGVFGGENVSYFVDPVRPSGPQRFLSGSVVQSRVPMLAPRPMIFNVRM